MYRKNYTGFTLVELLVTIVLIAITLAYAVPGFQGTIRNNRSAALSNNLVSAINLSRSEAVTRGISVSVCASSNQATCAGNTNWSNGWIVFADSNDDGAFNDDADGALCEVDGANQLIEDCLLRVWHQAKGGISVNAGVGTIRYLDSGFPDTTTTFNIVVPDCRGNQNRSVQISTIGRPDSSTTACS